MKRVLLWVLGSVLVACGGLCAVGAFTGPSDTRKPATQWVAPLVSSSPVPALTSVPPLPVPPVHVDPVLPHRDDGGDSSGFFVCRDGSISHAAHRQGACSHHGGIR